MAEFTSIRSQINSFKNKMIEDEKIIEFNGIINYMSLVILKYRETQLTIHQVLTQFKKGNLNPLLISPEEFDEQMKNIQYYVANRYKLPSFHFEELEKVVEVAVVHGIFSLIFQVEIPLLNTNDFKLYKMLPAPTNINNKFLAVKPTTTYFAINIRSKSYYLLTEKDIEGCSQMNKLYICNKHLPIHAIDDDSHCEVKIFMHDERSFESCNYQRFYHTHLWFELSSTNEWLFSIQHTETCKMECDETLERFKISGEGILSIRSGCKLEVSGTTLIGKEELTSTIHLSTKIPSKMSPLNLTISTNNSMLSQNSTKPLIVKIADFSSINHMVDDIKVQENKDIDLDFIPQQNIHVFVTYVLLGTTLVGMILSILWFKNTISKITSTLSKNLQSTRDHPNTVEFNIPSPDI